MAGIIDETVASLPDVQVCVDETEVLSDVIITRSRFIATHGGVIFGLDPTGKTVNVPTLDIFFFRDGKVARCKPKVCGSSGCWSNACWARLPLTNGSSTQNRSAIWYR